VSEELLSADVDSGVGVGIFVAVRDEISGGGVDNEGDPSAFLLCRVTKGVGVDGRRDRLNGGQSDGSAVVC